MRSYYENDRERAADQAQEQFCKTLKGLRKSVAGMDMAVARSIAADPATPTAELERLCAAKDTEVLAAIAANPNVSRVALDYVGQRAPAAALANPLLELWGLTDPEWMYDLSKPCGRELLAELYRKGDTASLANRFPHAFRLQLAMGYSTDGLALHRLGHRDPDADVRLEHACSIGRACQRGFDDNGLRISAEELEAWLRLDQENLLQIIGRDWCGVENFHERLYAVGGKVLLSILAERADCPAWLLEIALKGAGKKLRRTIAHNSNLTHAQQLKLSKSTDPQVWIGLLKHASTEVVARLHSRLGLLPVLLSMAEAGFCNCDAPDSERHGFAERLRATAVAQRKQGPNSRFIEWDWRGPRIFGLGCIEFLETHNLLETVYRLCRYTSTRNDVLEELLSSPVEEVRKGMATFFASNTWGYHSQRRIAMLRRLQQDPVESIRLQAMRGWLMVRSADLKSVLTDSSPRLRMAYVRQIDDPNAGFSNPNGTMPDFGETGLSVHFADDPDPAIRLKVLDILCMAFNRGFPGGITHCGVTAEELITRLIANAPDKATVTALILRHLKEGSNAFVRLPLIALDFVLTEAPEAAMALLVKRLGAGKVIREIGSGLRPVKALSGLAEHPSIFAKAVAARNGRTPMPVLRNLAQHQHPLIHAAIRKNPKAKSILTKSA